MQVFFTYIYIFFFFLSLFASSLFRAGPTTTLITILLVDSATYKEEMRALSFSFAQECSNFYENANDENQHLRNKFPFFQSINFHICPVFLSIYIKYKSIDVLDNMTHRIYAVSKTDFLFFLLQTNKVDEAVIDQHNLIRICIYHID